MEHHYYLVKLLLSCFYSEARTNIVSFFILVLLCIGSRARVFCNRNPFQSRKTRARNRNLSQNFGREHANAPSMFRKHLFSAVDIRPNPNSLPMLLTFPYLQLLAAALCASRISLPLKYAHITPNLFHIFGKVLFNSNISSNFEEWRRWAKNFSPAGTLRCVLRTG